MSVTLTRKSRMGEVRRAFNLGARAVTDWAANTQVEYAKQEAPVRTGRLRSEIHAVKRNQYRTDAVSSAPYSIYVNYGTSRMPANPFWDRALSRVASEFPQKVRALVRL